MTASRHFGHKLPQRNLCPPVPFHTGMLSCSYFLALRTQQAGQRIVKKFRVTSLDFEILTDFGCTREGSWWLPRLWWTIDGTVLPTFPSRVRGFQVTLSQFHSTGQPQPFLDDFQKGPASIFSRHQTLQRPQRTHFLPVSKNIGLRVSIRQIP